MTQTIRFDKHGQKIPAKVRLGNERLSSRVSGMSGGDFIICEDHGTVPLVRVRKANLVVKACRHCIVTYCELTEAVPASAVILVEHPNGHSF